MTKSRLIVALLLFIANSVIAYNLFAQDMRGSLTPHHYGFYFFEKHANSGHLRDTIINSRRVGYTEVQRFCGHFTYYAVCVGDVGNLCNKPLLKMDATSKKGYRLTDVVLTRGKQLSHMVDYVVGISHNATISALANRKGELLALKWEYQKKEDNAPSLEACAKLFDTLSKLKIYPVWDEVITDGSLSEQDNLALFFVPFTKRTTKEEFVKIYNDNLAIVREDHNFRSFIESASEALALLKSDPSFRSYIEGATEQVAAERMVEFIDKMVELTPKREQRLVQALCRYIKTHQAEHYASEWSALCAMIDSRVAEGDYYMLLKGRIVDSVVAKHLTKEEFSKLKEQYIPYFKRMIVALRRLESDYNRYNCAVHPDVVVTEFGFPKIDDIIWYLSQTKQICISDALANDNKHPSKFLGIDILHF